MAYLCKDKDGTETIFVSELPPVYKDGEWFFDDLAENVEYEEFASGTFKMCPEDGKYIEI